MFASDSNILALIILISSVFGAALCFLTRGIMYYCAQNDNQQVVAAAAQAGKWGWPSGMHQYANGKAHMKEFAVMVLALVQRLIRDKKSDYALVVLCVICHSISAVLIFLIAQNYWDSYAAFFVFCLYLSSSWPKLIALWGGVVAVAEVTFLASVLCFQNAVEYHSYHMVYPPTVEINMTCFLIGGIFIGLTLFSSASSRKYLPLSLAAYLFSLNIYLVNEQGLKRTDVSYSILVAAIVGVLILGVFIIRTQIKSVITRLYEGRGPKFLQNLLAQKSSKPLEHYLDYGRQLCALITSLSLLMIADLLLSFLFAQKTIYWQSQLMVFEGVLVVTIVLTYPNVFRNLKGYYFYSQYGKPTWRSRFYGYREFFAGMGKPIKDNMRGAGWAWVAKYFYRMSPVLCFAGILYTGVYLYESFTPFNPNPSISISHQSISIFGLELSAMLIIFLLAISPIVMAEASGAVQVGRSYYPGLLGLLLFILILRIEVPSLGNGRIFVWLFSICWVAIVIWHFIWNIIVFFTDILPSRMAPVYLVRKLRKLGIKRFYTYDSPYNDALVKCFPEEIQKEFEICFIKSIKDVKEGYVVIPPTNPKSVMMSDYPQGKEKEFTEDPALNEWFRSGELKRKAVASFKTFGSSRFWVHEAEVPTYRDLILKDITDEDRFRGLAWLIKI